MVHSTPSLISASRLRTRIASNCAAMASKPGWPAQQEMLGDGQSLRLVADAAGFGSTHMWMQAFCGREIRILSRDRMRGVHAVGEIGIEKLLERASA
ncbi:MAG: hypothetical protein WBO15_13370, partial [Gammaproteobacteria bacterium]